MRFVAHACTVLTAAMVLAACDRSTAPLVPAELEALSPLAQSGIVATDVAQPPAVRVTDAGGRPVPGVPVSFAVTAGAGTVSAGAQVTDARGEARLPAWRLGTAAGDNVLTAAAEGLAGAALTFRATAQPGPAAGLSVLTQPPISAASGALLQPQPVLRLHDEYGNAVRTAGIAVSAGTTTAGVELADRIAVTDADGVATWTALRLFGPTGVYTLTFSAPGLAPAVAGAGLTLVAEPAGTCTAAMPLGFTLGEMRRVTLDDAGALTCLDFDSARNAGEQYLVLFENMPLYGGYNNSLFHAGAAGRPASPRDLSYTLRSTPRAPDGTLSALTARQVIVPTVPEQALHAWDFGAGRIYEIRPEDPPGGVTPPRVLNAAGQLLELNSAAANPQVGDTIHGIWMVGLDWLGIPAGNQRAVIRHVSNELIIAEDVRLATLQRRGGGFNTPLHPDTLQAIAHEYAAHAKGQSDMLFAGRHNAAVENSNGGRVLAVHSVMYEDNIWGYTYSSGNYFVFDYWVGETTKGVTGTLNQRVQRVVDNLFMHEVAHMREFGMLQRESMTGRRGNQWLVEGFARFSERLPIAARLLGTPDPSRTANVVLPRNDIFGGGYFRDDVPTFLNMMTAMVGGYQHSSYVFDYFADQVALRGGDWRLALREFVVAAGRADVLDGVVMSRLGITFPELFTRARLALYLDDIGTPGLPDWTQYHQYQLRASRPVGGTGVDPRNLVQPLVPGAAAEISHSIPAGGAWGYLIDGTAATGSALFNVTGPATGNAVMSVTRIR